jgi:hypothetical protein
LQFPRDGPQDTVDELPGLGGAIFLGQVHGLVNGGADGDVAQVEQLGQGHAQQVAVHHGHALERPALGKPVQAGVNLLAVGEVFLAQGAAEIVDGRAQLAGLQGREGPFLNQGVEDVVGLGVSAGGAADAGIGGVQQRQAELPPAPPRACSFPLADGRGFRWHDGVEVCAGDLTPCPLFLPERGKEEESGAEAERAWCSVTREFLGTPSETRFLISKPGFLFTPLPLKPTARGPEGGRGVGPARPLPYSQTRFLISGPDFFITPLPIREGGRGVGSAGALPPKP